MKRIGKIIVTIFCANKVNMSRAVRCFLVLAIAEMGQAQSFHSDIPKAWDDAEVARFEMRFYSFDQGPNCNVQVESRMPVEIRDGLARRGHRLVLTGEYQ